MNHFRDPFGIIWVQAASLPHEKKVKILFKGAPNFDGNDTQKWKMMQLLRNFKLFLRFPLF